MNSFETEEGKNESQMDSTNKLLLEMVKNQKLNAKNLIKVFVTIIICYTVLLLGMVAGFFIYESQFETIEGETEYVVQQEATSDNGGNAIVNNGGDVNYGESSTEGGRKNPFQNKDK